MKKYVVKEVINAFHIVTVDDEIDIEDVINEANEIRDRFDSGDESVGFVLEGYYEKYGFDYEVNVDGAGMDVIDLEVLDEV